MKPYFRSVKNKIVGGVCGGIAEYFDVSPLAIRILTVLSIPFTSGFTITFYFLAMVMLPKDYS